MDKHVKTDRPCISIVMSVYDPRLDWLQEQLESLNRQTYPNLELRIADDCSPTVPLECIEKLVCQCITSFPYTIQRNPKNLGYNASFQNLTALAQGKYIAYCDQDDIWLPEKLTSLYDSMMAEKSELACSDMYIIDGEGKRIANSITEIRRHHIFRSGEGLCSTLWYSNFASGCALLVNSTTAKEAIPFNPYMYYDHYITLFSANKGRISFVDRPLIMHREHGKNQSSTMQGVVDKDSYIRLRIETVCRAVEWLSDHFPSPPELKAVLEEGRIWMEARLAYANGNHKYAKAIWKHRKISPAASLFEIAMPWMPNIVFKAAIWARSKNYI